MTTAKLFKPQISKELKSACDYYRRTNPKRFPLEGLYLFPGSALGSGRIDSGGLSFSKSPAADLYEGFKRINRFMNVPECADPFKQDIPIISKGPPESRKFYILDGQDQYLRFIDSEKYLLLRADEHIAMHLKTMFAELFKNVVVLELASGNGTKTSKILDALPKGQGPVQIIFEDLVLRLAKQAKNQICNKDRQWSERRTKRPEDDRAECLAGDLLSDETWARINALLEKYKDHKLVVLSQGATLVNNFTRSQLDILLGHLGKLKLGTQFLISIDSTLSEQALRDEYYQPAFFHLVLTSITNIMREIDPSFKPCDITGCDLRIVRDREKTAKIGAVIEWNGQQLIQEDIVKVGMNEVISKFGEHNLGVVSRFKAGGSEFSKIDQAFVHAVRTDRPWTYSMTQVTTMPGLT